MRTWTMLHRDNKSRQRDRTKALNYLMKARSLGKNADSKELRSLKRMKMEMIIRNIKDLNLMN